MEFQKQSHKIIWLITYCRSANKLEEADVQKKADIVGAGFSLACGPPRQKESHLNYWNLVKMKTTLTTILVAFLTEFTNQERRWREPSGNRFFDLERSFGRYSPNDENQVAVRNRRAVQVLAEALKLATTSRMTRQLGPKGFQDLRNT